MDEFIKSFQDEENKKYGGFTKTRKKRGTRSNMKTHAYPKDMGEVNGLTDIIKKQEKISYQFSSDICASFQNAVAETLIIKCKKALSNYNLSQLVIGGGVAANLYIRKRVKEELTDIELFFPDQNRCTDNGAMVAVAGYYGFENRSHEKSIKIRPRWSLSEI